jgi:hypothetical protein
MDRLPPRQFAYLLRFRSARAEARHGLSDMAARFQETNDEVRAELRDMRKTSGACTRSTTPSRPSATRRRFEAGGHTRALSRAASSADAFLNTIRPRRSSPCTPIAVD